MPVSSYSFPCPFQSSSTFLSKYHLNMDEVYMHTMNKELAKDIRILSFPIFLPSKELNSITNVLLQRWL